jgi:hypothetical protein
VKAEWASAIIYGGKCIENRSRPLRPGQYWLRTTGTKITAQHMALLRKLHPDPLPTLPRSCIVGRITIEEHTTLLSPIQRLWSMEGSLHHPITVNRITLPPVSCRIAGPVTTCIVPDDVLAKL